VETDGKQDGRADDFWKEFENLERRLDHPILK
jgi:hypothetical protein